MWGIVAKAPKSKAYILNTLPPHFEHANSISKELSKKTGVPQSPTGFEKKRKL
jgi:hypothetical protein